MSVDRIPIVLLFFVASIIPLMGLSTALGMPQRQRAQPETLRGEDVSQAIDKAEKYLLNQRNRQGDWINIGQYQGSGTALVTLALLNSGRPANSPEMQNALRSLRLNPPDEARRTYVVALRLMCYAAAGESGKPYRQLMEEDVAWLVEHQEQDGGWNYDTYPGSSDFSNTQFALLGLHDAARAGISVPRRVWEKAIAFWSNSIAADGSFSYYANNNSPNGNNGAATCSGISSLVIIAENLASAQDYLENNRVRCCGEEPENPMLAAAQGWMASNFSVTHHPTQARRGGLSAKYYYLYGMERAARLTGQRFFGDRDWYREGAAELINLQDPNSGNWVGNGHSEEVPEVATSLALLFLSKGLRPVLFGKYFLESSGLGVEHPSGIHYLTRQIEKEWDVPLNWQSIDGSKANVNDLRESPVLFLSGREAIRLTAGQKQELKRYVESGRFLFVEACQGDGCGDQVPFDPSFQELMRELFPESKLEKLQIDHPFWNANFPIQPNPEWPLWGLQACCRTSVIYCPRNLSGFWQLDQPGILRDCPAAVREQVEYCRKIGINVAAYATGRILERRLDVEKLGNSVVTALKGRALVFPKLRLGGGDDDAASAWRNMQEAAARSADLQIDVEKTFVDVDFDQMSDHTLLFAHGRQRFSLTEDERNAIKQYLENGGMLFIDSICSSQEYASSVRRELKLIFPSSAVEPVPSDHSIWNDSVYGEPVGQVTLRHPDGTAKAGFRAERTSPQLEGVTIGERLAVIFSPYDLSCAMENSTASNCEGYTRQDAAKIAMRVILYRLLSDD